MPIIAIFLVLLLAGFLYMMNRQDKWGYLLAAPLVVFMFAAWWHVNHPKSLDDLGYVLCLIGFGSFCCTAFFSFVEGMRGGCDALDKKLGEGARLIK